MNNKIPLRVLAQQMAQASGISENECQEFVKALFRNISEDLYRGQTIELNGIGSFSVDASCSDPIQFHVDANLASELNAPFSFFQPLTLSDTLNQEEVEKFNEITVVIDSQQDKEESEATIDITDNDTSVPIAEELISVENSIIGEIEPADEMTDNTFVHSESEDKTAEFAPSPLPILDTNSSDDEIKTPSIPPEIPADELPSLNDSSKDNDSSNDDFSVAETVQPVVGTQPNEFNQIYIPEEEEEYVEYHSQRRSSRFWIGFIVGLLLGLVLAAVALAIYVVQFLNYPLSSLG